MANKKCAGCNMYKPLIGDYCAECRSVRAYNNNLLADEVLAEIMSEATHNESAGSSQSAGSFSEMSGVFVREYQKKRAVEEHEPTKEEAFLVLFDRIISNNSIPAQEAKKYKPQLNYLVRKYLFHLLGGHFGLADKDRYMANKVGSVVDVRGRWVVYKVETERPDGTPVELRPEVKELIATVEKNMQVVLDRYQNSEEGDEE